MLGNLGFREVVTLVMMLSLIGLVLLWPAWRIVTKTGYPGVLSLGVLIPGINLLLLLYLAVSRWPIEQELDKYKATGA